MKAPTYSAVKKPVFKEHGIRLKCSDQIRDTFLLVNKTLSHVTFATAKVDGFDAKNPNRRFYRLPVSSYTDLAQSASLTCKKTIRIGEDRWEFVSPFYWTQTLQRFEIRMWSIAMMAIQQYCEGWLHSVKKTF